MSAEPHYLTPVVGAHRARHIGRLSAVFDRRPQEWQDRAAALISERTPDGGRLAHPTVVLSVQRQAGKSALMRAVILARALLSGSPQRIFYTAQSGKYARDFWAECVTEWSAPGSPLAGSVHAKWSQGAEVATFANGSTFSPFPPTRDALHGKQTDLVIIDEAWKHDNATGAAIMQAVTPTQATRPDPQVLIVSAAGTHADSPWFRDWIELGRAGHVALIEYGIGDDGDPGDLDSVIAAHPAVGETITEDTIRAAAATMPAGEFGRAFGNSWQRTMERTIPAELWEARATTEPLEAGTVTFGAAVAMDGSRSAIVSARAGRLEVVASLPGSAWLAGRLAALAGRDDSAGVIMLRTGPDGPIADELDRLGVELHTLTVNEYAIACESWWRRLTAGVLQHRPHPQHDASIANAVRRTIGDGWVWGRRASAGPIPELIAGTLADWLDLHRPEPAGAPMIWTGDSSSFLAGRPDDDRRALGRLDR